MECKGELCENFHDTLTEQYLKIINHSNTKLKRKQMFTNWVTNLIFCPHLIQT